MKVVHIATTDGGGAGKGLLNLHEALLSLGVESNILVAQKTTQLGSVVCMKPNHNLYQWSNNRIIRKVQKIMRRRGKWLTMVEQWDKEIEKASLNHHSLCFTSPFSNYDISQHPLVSEADIIHLHWVGNFLDYPTFFTKVNKPIVWTLRDENPGLGGFHYTSDKKECNEYYAHIENAFLEEKRKALLLNDNIKLIALSEAMKTFCSSVDFLKNKETVKIYNPINVELFSAIEKNIARKVLNLDNNALVLSFVSVSIKDHRKGIKQLVDAIKLLNYPIKLLCVGINDYFVDSHPDITCYGPLENAQLLSLIYSASDFFVTPSRQESFGKTTIEAMLCGTPVISTATGIAPEIINEESGFIINSIEPEEIALAIREVSKRNYDRLKIREKAQHLFDPIQIAQQHINLYDSLL